MYSKTVLPNGLSVITVPMDGVKTVTVLVMVGTGSRYETKEVNGISHFLEHLVFKGTKKRPTSKEIFVALDSVGAAHNAFTGKDQTGFYVKVAAKHLELALDILSDVILNPLFDPAEIDKERGVITEEINMYDDEPQALVGRLFAKVCFPDNALGWRIEGTKENIAKINRDQVKSYAAQTYHSGSMVVGVAGQIAGKDLLSKYFTGVPRGEKNPFVPFVDKQKKPAVAVHFKKTDQAHIVLGLRSLPLSHPDRYALALLANIYGGNTSSRLFMEVREKRGLAYYVGAGNDSFWDTGILAVGAGLALSKIDEAIKVILEQSALMSAKPPRPDELRRAKDYFAGRMLLGLEDSFNQASMYVNQELLEEKIETPEEILAQVEKVTTEDILRVAGDIFVEKKLNLAIVGPFKDGGRFAKILKL
ncbi:insulinase family protein [Candidatus Microgenomates bacterium]|nr:insulinase family protein [Candidatus Microgenomates bacterium]